VRSVDVVPFIVPPALIIYWKCADFGTFSEPLEHHVLEEMGKQLVPYCKEIEFSLPDAQDSRPKKARRRSSSASSSRLKARSRG